MGCGAHRATETKSVGDSQEGRERREILTWKARESKRVQDMRKQRGERQWRGERGLNTGNKWWREKERERHQDRERDRKREGWGKEIPTNRQRWRESVKEERGEREEKWRQGAWWRHQERLPGGGVHVARMGGTQAKMQRR